MVYGAGAMFDSLIRMRVDPQPRGETMIGHGRKEGQDKAVLSSLEIASILEGHLDTGYSVDRFGDSPHAGYAVGMHGHEARFCYKPHIRIIADWVQDRIDLWAVSVGHWVFGCWQDKEYTYLDISLVITNRDEATQIGQQNNQKAIYDCAEQEEIRLDGPCSTCKDRSECGYCPHSPEESADEPETDEQRREALEIDLLIEKPREHVSGDPRVSEAEEPRPHRTPCGDKPCDPCPAAEGIGDPCKGCQYDGAERPGKCSVCPVER